MVGEEDTVSHVHVDRLTEYIALFKVTTTPQWKENVKQEMRLPEEERKSFEHFVQ